MLNLPLASLHSITSSARAIRSLFRPHCHRGSDCGCNCLNRPTVLALRNDSEGFACCQVVQKPFALSFHVPLFFWPDSARGSRVILPSGVNVILNLVPPGVEAVKGSPLEEGCLDVARSHRLSREGSARSE